VGIIPFELLLGGTGVNGVVRIARIGRLYKLVKLFKLLRVFKIVKDNSKIKNYYNEVTKTGVAFERLLFFILIFLILCHFVSCLWIFVALIDGSEYTDGTWMEKTDSQETTNSQLYLTAFYFTVTTITTVGYGDISASKPVEQICCIIIMIIGVISFSFATGSLASIL
jgi:hypothetical protein